MVVCMDCAAYWELADEPLPAAQPRANTDSSDTEEDNDT